MVDPVRDAEHIRGAKDAPVTIVEYGDFQCPNCKQAAPVAALLLGRFEGRIRLVFRHASGPGKPSRSRLSGMLSQAVRSNLNREGVTPTNRRNIRAKWVGF